jgi:hypothetical protein
MHKLLIPKGCAKLSGEIKTSNLTRLIYLGLGLFTLLVTILFCGISRDPEFYEPTIFVKHRPTFKIHFHTPIGESDMTLSDLSAEGKKEELHYKEFVEDQNVYSDNLNRLWFLPPILIQLTLTFLSFGTIKQNVISSGRFLLHFFINLVSTSLIVSLMLFNERPWQLFGLTTIVLIINVWTIRFTQSKSRAEHSL